MRAATLHGRLGLRLGVDMVLSYFEGDCERCWMVSGGCGGMAGVG